MASSGSKRSDESSGRHESKRGAKASRLRRMVSNPTRESAQRRARIGNMWTGGHPAQSAAEIHNNRSRFCAKANFTRSLTLKQGMRVQHRSWRHRLKLFIDEPQSSICAKYTWVILMLAVVASIAVLCVQTLDVDGARHDCTTVKALKTIETVCNCAFSLEVVIRIVAYSTDYDSVRQLTREVWSRLPHTAYTIPARSQHCMHPLLALSTSLHLPALMWHNLFNSQSSTWTCWACSLSISSSFRTPSRARMSTASLCSIVSRKRLTLDTVTGRFLCSSACCEG